MTLKRWVQGTQAASISAAGFTLVETMVVIGILALAGSIVIAILTSGFQNLTTSRSRLVALAIANERMEIARNMPYASLGTTTGWPTGAIPATLTVVRNGIPYTVTTRIDYIDDPFDGNVLGTILGKPRDTVPNDYKRVETSVQWPNNNSKPALLSSFVAPRGLESSSNTGAIILRVADSHGNGVPQATVHVTNSSVVPAIDITNTTDNDGNLQLLSLPPSLSGYRIEISKSGYSSERTYSMSEVTPSTPTNPDLLVAADSATPKTLYIDRTSTLNVATTDERCTPIGSIPLSLNGTKTIATNPTILKYTSTPPTNPQGTATLSNLEWDDYILSETSAAYDLAGVIPPAALSILANTTQNITLVLAPHTTNSLRVTVKDAGTKMPLTGASVHLTGTGTDVTKATGVGYLTQTDWSGGPGQPDVGDLTKFFSADGTIDPTSTAGSVQLKKTTTTQTLAESFSSTTNRDPVATTADWNTSEGVVKLPLAGPSYASNAVAQSIKLNATVGRVVAATLTAIDAPNGQTISYALSADGGTNFESVTPGTPHTFVASGGDLRFRISLSTSNPAVTPTVDSITINYTIDTYAGNGKLTSSSFDTKGGNTFRELLWSPVAQPQSVGPDPVKFQIATNNDDATWNFLGPDGTAGTFYTTSSTTLNAIHNGQRYLRYQLTLTSADAGQTPTLADLSIGYTSGCIPPGQVFFSGLNAATYTLDVSMPNYTPNSSSVQVNGTTSLEVLLTPTP